MEPSEAHTSSCAMCLLFGAQGPLRWGNRDGTGRGAEGRELGPFLIDNQPSGVVGGANASSRPRSQAIKGLVVGGCGGGGQGFVSHPQSVLSDVQELQSSNDTVSDRSPESLKKVCF